MYPKHVLITGATSGFGLFLLEKVIDELEEHNHVQICLICQNSERGNKVKSKMLMKHPQTKIIPIEVDFNSVQSILHGCSEIKHCLEWLDVIIFNDESLPRDHLMVENSVHTAMTTLNGGYQLWSFDNVFKNKQIPIGDNLNLIFGTAVFGHYKLIQQLLPLLSRGTYGEKRDYAQIIWTTYGFPFLREHSPNKIFSSDSSDAYYQSKCVLEAISIELNRKYNKKGIFSHVCSPGAMITNFQMVVPSFPYYLWYIFTPLLLLVRLFASNLTLFHSNACQSYLWLIKKNPRDLDPKAKYCSSTTVFNENYILKVPIKCPNTKAVYNEVNYCLEKCNSEHWLDHKLQELKEGLMRFHLV